MTYAELKKLEQLTVGDVVRHHKEWYLVTKEGQTWSQLAGPFDSRKEAIEATKRAYEEWRGIPKEIRSSYLKAMWAAK